MWIGNWNLDPFFILSQAVLTTIETGAGSEHKDFDAYEYTVHSHSYLSESIPTAKFSYDLSPIQIVVREEERQWYTFITSTCAIVGGVFTVAGILDAMVYKGVQLATKRNIGKLS